MGDDKTDKPVLSRTTKRRMAKTADLIADAKAMEKGRLCRGKVKLRPDMSKPAGPENAYFLNDDGSIQTRPCKRLAIKGGKVCPKHGGKAPQVRKNADRMLLAAVEPSLVRLLDLVHQDDHKPTALGAIRTVLERAGTKTPIGALSKDVGEKNTRPIIQIGIKVGGIAQPTVDVRMLGSAPSGDDDSEEGEIVGRDEDDE